MSCMYVMWGIYFWSVYTQPGKKPKVPTGAGPHLTIAPGNVSVSYI